MTKEEIDILVEKYFKADDYKFPTEFEHRVDPQTSAITYSLIRHFKPKNCLEIGTWLGGITCLIMKALQKNGDDFLFIASELADDLREKTKENVLRVCWQIPVMIGDITQNLDMLPKSLDFVHIDTDHDTPTTEFIFRNVVPKVKKGGLVAMHDWPVMEDNRGKLTTKEDLKIDKVWPETKYILALLEEDKLPLEKLYWNFTGNGGSPEGGWWLKK